jgi:hypothetical protein
VCVFLLLLLLLFKFGGRAEDVEIPSVKVFYVARTLDEVVILAPLLDHPTVFDIHVYYIGATPLQSATIIMPSPVLLEGEAEHARFACDDASLLAFRDVPILRVFNGDAAACFMTSKALASSCYTQGNPAWKGRFPGIETRGQDGQKSVQGIFKGLDLGAANRDSQSPAPLKNSRLRGMQGKWEGLVVWAGSWFVAFWALVRFRASDDTATVMLQLRLSSLCGNT